MLPCERFARGCARGTADRLACSAPTVFVVECFDRHIRAKRADYDEQHHPGSEAQPPSARAVRIGWRPRPQKRFAGMTSDVARARTRVFRPSSPLSPGSPGSPGSRGSRGSRGSSGSCRRPRELTPEFSRERPTALRARRRAEGRRCAAGVAMPAVRGRDDHVRTHGLEPTAQSRPTRTSQCAYAGHYVARFAPRQRATAHGRALANIRPRLGRSSYTDRRPPATRRPA